MKTLIYLLTFLSVLVSNAQTRVYPYSDGHRWGLTDQRREILAAPQFDTIPQLTRAGHVICRRNGKYGAVDLKGKTTVAFRYEEMTVIEFYSRAVVRIGSKYGLINVANGSWVLPARYDQIERTSSFGDLKLAVTIGAIVSYVDSNGKALSPKATKQAAPVKRAAHVVEPLNEEEKELYVSDLGNGSWKIRLMARNIDSTRIYEVKGYTKVEVLWFNSRSVKGRLKAIKDGRAGILDIDGKVVGPFEYDDIRFDYHIPAVLTKLGDKTGVITGTPEVFKKPVLKQVIAQNYDYNAYLVEMPDGRKGFLDMDNGEIYIP